MATRAKLHDRMAKEAYRLTVNDDKTLSTIAGILAGIEAIEYILNHDIDPPVANSISHDGASGQVATPLQATS